jgi:hypothetical protein
MGRDFAAVNPVPRTYVRDFGALLFGEIQTIHPVPTAVNRECIVFSWESWNGVHPRTHVQGVLWYGVKSSGQRPLLSFLIHLN